MKRHPALLELSRDHHHALVVARELKRAEPSTAEQARARFLDYWEADGQSHFLEEEDILLPALAEFIPPVHPAIKRVLSDHDRIRGLASEVGDGVEVLRELGSELEQHVRREERELFPLIEQSVPEPQLVELAARLAREDS